MQRKLLTKAPNIDQKTGALPLYVKTVNEDGTFEGYGSVFGVKDSYEEIVVAGAFLESLADHEKAGTLPAMLWQHRMDKPIGIYTEMREDKKGLLVKGRLALETQLGKEAYTLLKMGAMNGLSIGYRVRDSSYDETTRIRTLKQLDLWEVSLVTFPANGESRIDTVKADFGKMDKFSEVERHLREAGGFSRSDATAIVAVTRRLEKQHREDVDAKSQFVTAGESLIAKLNA